MTVIKFCPVCYDEDLERCFGVSPELWGYSDHCKACGWRGQAKYFIDRDGDDERRWEREPFTDWPNGQGVYE